MLHQIPNSTSAFVTRQNMLFQKAQQYSSQITICSPIIFTQETCIDHHFNWPDFQHEHVVYLIKILDFGIVKNALTFKSRFTSFKKNSKFKLPQINNSNDSDVLYIGKSTGNFTTRLKNHLLASSKKTYALQICQWPKTLADMAFELHYGFLDPNLFKDDNHEDAKAILEIIEGGLQLEYRPLLGRTGH
jgi:hypothetical protein